MSRTGSPADAPLAPAPPDAPPPAGRLYVGFRTRLFVVSVVLMVLFALGSTLWLESSLRPLLERQAIADLQSTAELARVALEAHPDSSQRLTDRAGALAEPAHMRLTVIDPDGAVLADSEIDPRQLATLEWHGDRPEVLEALSTRAPAAARRRSATLGQDMVYVAVPVSWPDGRTAILRAARTTATADAPVHALYRLLVVVLAGGLVVALLMTQLAASTMNRDLGVLLRHTTGLARGEASPPLELHTSVELAGIAGTVDQMAQETQRVIRALAEERRRSAIVLQAVREGLMSIDHDDRLTLVNAACHALVGIDADHLGSPLSEAIDSPPLTALIAEARREGEATTDLVLPDPSGTPDADRVIEARASQGEAGSCVVSLHDITHLRRLETIRRDFVTNVSHELRTPISIVQASAEALQDGAIDEPRYAAQFLDAILRNTERLRLLTQDILQLSRIESGHLLLRAEEVTVSEVVSDVVEILHQRSAARGQTITSAIPPGVTVIADAGSLEQVLVNLLDNAMKYTPNGGTITVCSEVLPGERVRIDVADDGPGVVEAHRARLFERFYRVDPGRSRDEGGTGLGLAIVKHLAEAMDGQVGMRPNVPTGSVFWLELPEAPDLDAEEPTIEGLLADIPGSDRAG